ncbi:MAG: hypothetical protein J3T61_12400 [Candidatus Brocadiales bacterium]|nr:hypothetical protein [Candidatus Bathyanammoxibius sp.]
MGSDRQERERVRSRIGSLILEFCRQNKTFFMEELRSYVGRNLVGCIAPDSPGRILRQLRQQGELNYKVVLRRQSLYRVVPVERPAEQAELFAKTA